jgi:hypothetical protein
MNQHYLEIKDDGESQRTYQGQMVSETMSILTTLRAAIPPEIRKTGKGVSFVAWLPGCIPGAPCTVPYDGERIGNKTAGTNTQKRNAVQCMNLQPILQQPI